MVMNMLMEAEVIIDGCFWNRMLDCENYKESQK